MSTCGLFSAPVVINANFALGADGGHHPKAKPNMGRLIGTTTTYSFLPNNPFTNSYTYDAASNRTGYTAPDGSTNAYTYDTLNRLSSLTNSWAGSFGFSYDALSRRTQMTRPNGVNTNYSYDSLSRLLSVLHQAGGSTIDGAVYTLDAAGNSGFGSPVGLHRESTHRTAHRKQISWRESLRITPTTRFTSSPR